MNFDVGIVNQMIMGVLVADLPDSYILADDIEWPVGNKLPLWLVGLLILKRIVIR